MNLSGVLVIDKPSGVTSHDVINKLRKLLRTQRIGHTGTLDPMASGVLLACVGKATKVVQFLIGWDKGYEAQIRLGVTTDTYDGEGKIIQTNEDLRLSEVDIRKAIRSFKGKIWQVPPLHSAIKYKGKRLYQYARAKEKVQVKGREVEIKELEVLDINQPYLKLRISCSKGTYIRSLAHDLGQQLGCGAYLLSLRRTRVGPFALGEALNLEDISSAVADDKLKGFFIPVEKALEHLPGVVIKEGCAQKVCHGVPLLPASVSSIEGDFERNQTIAIKDGGRKVLAVGKALCSSEAFLDKDREDKLCQYLRVIQS
jgi:tRNA pseudouridine55 synthase